MEGEGVGRGEGTVVDWEDEEGLEMETGRAVVRERTAASVRRMDGARIGFFILDWMDWNED